MDGVRRWNGEALAVPVVLLAVVFAAFSPVLHNAFVQWDDDVNLLENPGFRGLTPAHLRWMLTTTHLGHWHPLTWLTFGLDYTLWGMNPSGYHLTNLVLHLASVLAFYALARVLLARIQPETGPRALRLGAAAAALFFGLHPLRVESVAWASERRDVLSGLFLVLATLGYLRAHGPDERARVAWGVTAFVCYALSLLAKAWAITLPAVLLALDVYPLRRLPPRAGERWTWVIAEKIPWVLLAAGTALMAMRAVRVEAAFTLAQHGVPARILQAAYGLVFYLSKTALPVRLSPLYLLEQSVDTTALRYLVSLPAVAALTAVLLAFRRRWPWALLAWTSYVIMVSPVLGFVQSGPQITADRYTYVACLPWAVVVGAGVLQLARHAPAMLVAALSAAVALALGALTVRQTAVWRDSRHLWEHVLALDADNYFAYAGRGVVRQAEGDLQGALADFDAALRRNPGLARVYNNRCVVRIALGDIEAALADCDSALRVSARFADAHLNRGIAYQMRGDLDRALADYTQAIEDALDDARSGRRASLALARAHYGRGNIQMAAGDLDGAIASFTEALRNDPAYLEAYNDRGRARQLRRDEAGATEDFARARALSATRTP